MRLLITIFLIFSSCLAVHAKDVGHLIIVAPEAFLPALKPFVEFKRKTRPVELLALEKVLKEEKGVDDPEKVKRRLFRLWKEKKAAYALLVGDADVFPVRYMVLDRVTPAAFDYAFYPSDLYYADLADAEGNFESWNKAHDGFHAGYFGEVRGEKNKSDPINYDGIHYLPEIGVGRWPVSTTKEVERLVAKSIRYEETLKGRPATAAYLVVGGWVDSRKQLTHLSQMLGDWKPRQLYYGSKEPASAANVVQLMNEGTRLIFHSGHGESNGWDQSFGVKHLGQLKNADKLPIILSAGCSTAYMATLPPYQGYVDVYGKEHLGSDAGEKFTAPPPPPAVYQKGKYNGTSLGEQLLRRSENGAIAYFGCNTGSQPCGLSLLEGFAQGIGPEKAATLGDAWQTAIRYYWTKERLADLKPTNDWYPPSIFFQGMKFMLFGDPSLPLR